MRDDDDLPVLNDVVRGGDEAVILSTRLGLALDPARARAPRRPLAGRLASPAARPSPEPAARSMRSPTRGIADGAVDPSPALAPEARPHARTAGDLETDDVTRIDLGADGSIDASGPIGIDASRDVAGRRASRRLAAPAEHGVKRAAPATAAPVGPAVAADAGDGASDEELDDTLALDDPPPVRERPRARRRESRVAIVPAADRSRPTLAANDRTEPGDAREVLDTARVERLVDEIVERHVAALRRDVRAALERTLEVPDARRA